MIEQLGDNIITTLVVVSHVYAVILGILYLGKLVQLPLFNEWHNKLWTFTSDHAWGLALAVSSTAMLGSLFYQHVSGHPPCLLCWWQRIFIYPQVFLLLASKYFKLKDVFNYVLILSGIGIILAGYHYGLQLHSVMNTNFVSTICSATDAARSCAQATWFKLGYITIPFMALSAFFLQLVFTRASK